jgi:alkylated DNA repair dioxygenase AlkB
MWPGCIQYRPGWVPEHQQAFDELSAAIPWEQLGITMFGRTVPVPRLTAWMGEAAYAYSGLVNEPKPWPPALANGGPSSWARETCC